MINKQSATQRKSKEKSETKKFTTKKKKLNLRVSKNVLPWTKSGKILEFRIDFPQEQFQVSLTTLIIWQCTNLKNPLLQDSAVATRGR